LRRHACNIRWGTFCPGWGSRKLTTFGLRVGLLKDLAEPGLAFGGVAELPENTQEASPWDMGGQSGHQLDFRTRADFNANEGLFYG
jgi:hypothetical protein